MTGVVKEFGLLDFPFLFSHAKQADSMVDGPLGKMLNARLSDKGIVVLGYFDLGFRNVTNSKRPITKGEDLDGLKLRVIPNPVFVETFKTFKANPEGLRPRRPEAAGDPEPGVPGNLPYLPCESASDALCRVVRCT